MGREALLVAVRVNVGKLDSTWVGRNGTIDKEHGCRVGDFRG